MLGAAVLASCRPAADAPRDAEAYFLWAGVPAPPALAQADTVYVLAGEVRKERPDRFVPLRPHAPSAQGPEVWLVVRTETLVWDEGIYRRIERDLARWEGGVRLAGLQVDFDAPTRELDGYAGFMRDLRRRLPERYRLSITGLLDWSANADPAALAAVGEVVDEVVIQTYQGRHTIPGYAAYLAGLRRLPMPYRVGIVEDGGWREPPWLARDRNYRGTVVFLTRP